MEKKKIVVVCPGRGSYSKDTLGYLGRDPGRIADFIKDIDARRAELAEPTISEMDGADKFKTSLHTKGEHASPLIYACSYLDFQSIDQDKFEIVAVCGNSMGWYLTLAFAGALDQSAAFEVIQGMGAMQKDKLIGGQVIYPVVNGKWQSDPTREDSVREVMRVINNSEGAHCELSIELGGYWVIGGNQVALRMLLEQLPQDGDYPFQLINHGAFHTSLMQEVAAKAQAQYDYKMFADPQYPMIDGRGHVWRPKMTDPRACFDYTFGSQVTEPYNFTKSIEVALKEFAPDHLLLLGPGGSLGGALGQIMTSLQWRGVTDKAAFTELQGKDPFLLAMGLAEQRALVV